MNIGNVSMAAFATAVWAAANKTVTAVNSVQPAITGSTNVNQTIAASATGVYSSPSAGRALLITIVTQAGAAGTAQFQTADGINTFTTSTISAGNAQQQAITAAVSPLAFQIKNNDAANAIKWSAAYTVIL